MKLKMKLSKENIFNSEQFALILSKVKKIN